MRKDIVSVLLSKMKEESNRDRIEIEAYATTTTNNRTKRKDNNNKKVQ
jgi:hypothetical protein